MVNIQGINTLIMWIPRGRGESKDWEVAVNAAEVVALSFVNTTTDGQPQTEQLATSSARPFALFYNNIGEVLADPISEGVSSSLNVSSLVYSLLVLPGQSHVESVQSSARATTLNYTRLVYSGENITEGGTASANIISLRYV